MIPGLEQRSLNPGSILQLLFSSKWRGNTCKKQGSCRALPLVLYPPRPWQLTAQDIQNLAFLNSLVCSFDGSFLMEVINPLREPLHTPGLECLLFVLSFSLCPMWDR